MSENTPFDPATYSYVTPLVNHILRSGGVGVTDQDGVLEQVTLALNIMDFHAGECESTLLLLNFSVYPYLLSRS